MRQQCRRGQHEDLSSSAHHALHPPYFVSALSVLPGLLVGTLATSAHAAGLECPEIGQAGVPDLTSDPARAKLLLGGARADLANEVSELINQMQLKDPSISKADITNGLIAAYCPLVVQAPG
jgi:hypothetical protein